MLKILFEIWLFGFLLVILGAAFFLGVNSALEGENFGQLVDDFVEHAPTAVGAAVFWPLHAAAFIGYSLVRLIKTA